MPRRPSDPTIHRRAVVAYHRAQALARSTAYQADLTALQAAGWFFRADGIETPGLEVWNSAHRAQAAAIRKRAGLRRLVRPERLRALTVKEIAETYADLPLFVDVPGWSVVPVPRRCPGARKALRPAAARWFVGVPVPLRRLADRHRLAAYGDAWRAWDGMREGPRQGRERRVIEEVWPGEWVPRPYGTEKAAIHKRLYARLALANRLIRAAYRPS